MNKPEILPGLADGGAAGAAPSSDPGAPVVGSSTPHESAVLHVSGAAPFTDDLPEPAGMLHAALGLSPMAHGRLIGIDLARLREQPGVVAVLTAGDIPADNNCGPLLHDDPILASGELRYLGQPVFAVIATQRDLARRAAALASAVIQAEPLPAVLTAAEAHAAGQYVLPPMHLTRGDPATHLARAPHRLQGHWQLGGQEQFYLEGQISLALPQEGGETVQVHCSTQHPSEMQQLVAHALGWAAHRVTVTCRRMGGGFGGKESQSAPFACIAAIAALKLQRAVKLRVDRDDDFLITGRRHPFDYRWDVGFDADGRVLAAEIDLISNAGHSADLSAPVMARAICHVDNAYWLPHLALHGYCARTNTQSNTAFRGFGGPQGAIAIEMILDGIARRLGLDPALVRQRNFYAAGQNTTPYGQQVEELHAQALTEQLLAHSRYSERRAEIDAFNAASPVLKKGLAFTPVKFGISFNVAHLNQAGALVQVYTDGSVLVNHGGTEMGQGLNTKVAQVVAHELGLPLSRVRCSATDTSKIANTSATAASTGSDLNGKAAQDAARKIKARLAALAAERFGCAAEQVLFEQGEVRGGGLQIPFNDLVAAAYLKRIQLWSDGFYATPGLHWNKAQLQGHPFYYFSWGGAVCEALVDRLTGESRITHTDILHDVGSSLNPALDLGQIEGGFIQGMGWLTMEALVWNSQGRLTTHAPSTYKVPTANDCPPELKVRFFGAPNASETIHRSKAVGEPPLLLGFAALFAIKDACAACGPAHCDPPLRAPATAEAVLDAIDAIRPPP